MLSIQQSDSVPKLFLLIAAAFYSVWAGAQFLLPSHYYDAPLERIVFGCVGVVLFLVFHRRPAALRTVQTTVAIYAGALYLHFFTLTIRSGISEIYALGFLVLLVGASLLFIHARHYVVFGAIVCLTIFPSFFFVSIPSHRITMLALGTLTILGTTHLLLHLRIRLTTEHYNERLRDYSRQKTLIAEQLSHAQRQAASYKQKAYYDGLTELPNRDYFLDYLNRSLQFAKRRDAPFAVLFCDLDGFKAVNDTHGHDAGDKVLRHFAKSFVGALRSSDFCARYAGDEFAAILPGIRSFSDIQAVCERLLNHTQKPVPLFDGITCRIGLSIGIVVYPDVSVPQASITDPADLLFLADVAMYEAKHNGKNRWVPYDKHLSTLSQIATAVPST